MFTSYRTRTIQAVLRYEVLSYEYHSSTSAFIQVPQQYQYLSGCSSTKHITNSSYLVAATSTYNCPRCYSINIPSKLSTCNYWKLLSTSTPLFNKRWWQGNVRNFCVQNRSSSLTNKKRPTTKPSRTFFYACLPAGRFSA